jgi:hypothetical protein
LSGEISLLSTATQPIITSRGLESLRPWATRGWTLQEQVLSRKCLFFFDDQVIWRCATGDFFEDIELEDSSQIRPVWSRSNHSKESSMLAGPRLHAVKIFNIENDEAFEENFKALAEAYAAKHLSYDSDVVNAFRGIFTGLGHECHHGTPANRFEEYLCWEDRGTENGRHFLQRREGTSLPTWSWMLWKGYLAWGRVNVNTRPLVVCYRLVQKRNVDSGRPENLTTLELVTPDRFSYSVSDSPINQDDSLRTEGIVRRDLRAADDEWKALKSRTPAPQVEQLESSVLSENHLIFYADVVDASIEETTQNRRDLSGTKYNAFSLGAQGRKFITDFYQPRRGNPQVENMSFIAIATYRGCMDVLAMMVSWKDRIAYRESMHLIKRAVWKRLEKDTRLVVLG